MYNYTKLLNLHVIIHILVFNYRLRLATAILRYMKLSVHLTLTAWSFISREENELVSSPRQRQVAESGVG